MNSEDEQENTDYPIGGGTNVTLILPPIQRRFSLKRHYVEPVLFLLAVSLGLFETAFTNVIEMQYCSSILDLPQEECLPENNSPNVPMERVQKFVTTFSTVRTAVEVTIPSIMSFFIGPWSDTYGRKPLLISSLIGTCITHSLYVWGSSIPSLKPIYFISFSIPYALSGGSTFIFLASFCYISDVTTVEERGTRFGLMQACLFLGTLVGMHLCVPLSNYSYTLVFAIATALIYLALIYTCLFVKESVVPSEIERNATGKNPFQMKHIRDLFEACFSKQTPRNRLKIFLVMILVAVSLLQLYGEMSVTYLFMQEVLKATMKEFTFLSSFTIAINSFNAFAGTWFLSKYLKLDDLLIISLAAFFRILAAFVVVFGWRIWHLYLSRLLASTLGMTGPLTRAFLSKIIPADELGKVFSLLASTESSMPLFGTVLYAFVYNHFLGTYPEAVFILSAFLMMVVMMLSTILVELHLSTPSSERNIMEAPSIN